MQLRVQYTGSKSVLLDKANSYLRLDFFFASACTTLALGTTLHQDGYSKQKIVAYDCN